MIARTSFLSAVLFTLACLPALAWGERGHITINRIAAASFPRALPAFVRTPSAIDEIASLGPQLDDLKGSGSAWDDENDPGHYVDIGDDGSIVGVVQSAALPENREAYDTALRTAHADQYRVGYLPYAIVEGWEQLRMDFAYWRVADYRARHAAGTVHGFAGADKNLEEALVLRDIGVWGHYVADGSQPLHTSIHFNGWGDYANPNGYSTAHNLHAFFESDFVNRYASVAAVARAQRSPSVHPSTTLTSGAQIMAAVARYLAESNAQVVPLYEIEKAGGFRNGTPSAVSFVDARLAAGAAELSDLVVWAWDDSLNEKVGYPARPVRDLLR